ncbi:hypothetical protein [Methanocella sp. MCL-LM]|uniref:hypothetical protein n=1 Tax=Methanocella sp. MCL-LM TaxID=3412035 RepID=UPI003C73FA37
MNTENMVARSGKNRSSALKFLPLIVLVLIWLWILLFVAVIGLNTTVFHSMFGWAAMFPHI